MDVIKMLERDHRQVERMLEELAESEPGPEREALVQHVEKALSLHMQFEEEHLYHLLAELEQEMATEAEVEHKLAREGLSQMKALVSEPGFGAAVEMLAAGISHHVEEEEGEAFPKLKQELDSGRLESLARTLTDQKRAAGMLVPDDASKEELLEIAQELGVEGRTSMTKDELRDALQTA